MPQASCPLTLLKEYIKSLVATQRIFPNIIPRPFGKDYTRSELNTIYQALKTALERPHPAINKQLVLDFKKIGTPKRYLHWFLGRHWEALVDILTEGESDYVCEYATPSYSPIDTPEELSIDCKGDKNTTIESFTGQCEAVL
ncbi:hypothetical protein [Spirosoma spitsbergense]|uniref:hypothetical protein n=1 Tax=Spirosoma spitsbergense TaxID=431554 RepID=UPI00038135B9|nr:hypothetical protein [Spirosoma spitsbergense]